MSGVSLSIQPVEFRAGAGVDYATHFKEREKFKPVSGCMFIIVSRNFNDVTRDLRNLL